MKQLYLWEIGYGWKLFEYKNISDIAAELLERGIAIGDEATIGDKASIRNKATIGDEATIGNKASIGYKAIIGYKASIGDKASIGNKASIVNKAIIVNEATIGDEATIGKTIFITGSRHQINYYGSLVHIGCRRLTIEQWEKTGEDIGDKEGYTEDEKEEYRSYLEIIKSIHYNL